MRTKNLVFSVFTLLLFASFAFAQQVTGVVVNDFGPVEGAAVTVDGTDVSTETDGNGAFSINASIGQSLKIVDPNTLAEKIFPVNRTNLGELMLSDAVIDLGKVVAIGYGGENRSEIGTAISLVDEEEINNVAIGNVSQILQGKAAGVRVNVGSGQPGGDPNVTIRGIASIAAAGAQPLYIIDDVPVESGVFASLNPNDIASMSILKDAAAQAIYGSRGGAGVIIITTKRGKEGRATLNYSTQIGLSVPGTRQFEMMSSRELLEFQRLVGRGAGAGLSDEQIAERAQINTDWEDTFFRTGMMQTHDLALSGGNDKTQYRTSLGYFMQEGIAQRSQLDRYSGSMNINHKFSDRFRLNTSLIGSFSRSNFIDSENAVALQNPYAATYLAAPYDPLYNEDGSFNTGNGLVGANAYENLVRNSSVTERIRATYSASLEYDIFDFLTARAFGSVDYRNSTSQRVANPGTHYGNTTNPGNNGSYRFGFGRSAIFSTNFSLEYHKTFNKIHNFSAQLFSELISDRSEVPFGFNTTVYDLNSNVPPGVQAATVSADLLPAVGGANGTPVNLISYFARVKYAFDDRYIVTLTGRRDSSSKFAENNKHAYFWSASAVWNMHNESFLEDVSFVDNLKLRFSAGTVGNQFAIGAFQTTTTYGAGTYNGSSTLAATAPGNPDLKWETQRSLNLGLEFGLFNQRLNGSIDVYDRITPNASLFINQELSATSGFQSQDINAGKMGNKGIEVELNFDLIRNESLTWNIFGNLAYNKNEILDLGQVDEFEDGTSIIREGLPYGTHYTVGWAGVNPANGEPLYYDLDGNVTNVFTADNRTTNFGTYISPFTGGFGTRIDYKNFYVRTLFTFENDYSRYNNQTFFQENPNFAQFNQLQIMNTMWQNPGDVTEVQSYLYPRQFSSKDIEDASYLRWREMEVGYSFPRDLLSSTFVKDIRIFVQAINLYTWTNWSGFDPEDDNNIAQYEYPTPRTYTLGLNFTF